MKCISCKGEWTPPPGKSVTECPFCKASIIEDKKPFNNAKDALQFIADTYGIEALLTKNLFSDIAPTLKDERELVKIFREKGVLDVLKTALDSSPSEQQNSLKRAMAKLPKYLHDSQDAISMLNSFAEVIGWAVKDTSSSPTENTRVINASAQIKADNAEATQTLTPPLKPVPPTQTANIAPEVLQATPSPHPQQMSTQAQVSKPTQQSASSPVSAKPKALAATLHPSKQDQIPQLPVAECSKPRSGMGVISTILLVGLMGLFIGFNMAIWIVWGVVVLSVVVFVSYSRSKYTRIMRKMQSSIRINDVILTQKGLVGKVIDIGVDCFLIEFGINRGVRIPVLKSEIEARRRVA